MIINKNAELVTDESTRQLLTAAVDAHGMLLTEVIISEGSYSAHKRISKTQTIFISRKELAKLVELYPVSNLQQPVKFEVEWPK